MKKLFPLSMSLAAIFLALLPFSCTTAIDAPKSPEELFPESYCVYPQTHQCFLITTGNSHCPGGGTLSDACPYGKSSSSSGGGGGGSSSSAPEYDYCVFAADRECLLGPATFCPPGGTLSNTCPYGASSSSSSNTGSSSSGGDSSSSTGSSSSSGGGGFSPGTDSSSSIGSISSESQAPPQFDGSTFIDQRDGKSYSYNIYSGRVWMTTNLNYSKGGTIGYCYKSGSELGTPGENLSGCDAPYGRNYTYAIATDGQPLMAKARGICPIGWHIPSSDEWSSSVNKILAGNYDVGATTPKWQNRPTYGFYWYSNAINLETTDIGFVFMGSSIFSVRPNYEAVTNEKPAKPADVFSVRCVMDEGAMAMCGSGTFNLTDELCVSGVKYPKLCGGATWDPNLQQCNDNVLSCLDPLPSGYVCHESYPYQTTTVNGKIWMTTNLRNSSGTWANAMNLYANCNNTNCSVNDPHQGKCPIGWHIPKQTEVTPTNSFFNDGTTWWTATQVTDQSAVALRYYNQTLQNAGKLSVSASVRCVQND